MNSKRLKNYKEIVNYRFHNVQLDDTTLSKVRVSIYNKSSEKVRIKIFLTKEILKEFLDIEHEIAQFKLKYNQRI